MASTTSRSLTKRCAENIAALHFIHPVPTQPTPNPVTSIQSRSADYTLSFEKERSLSNTLAFLAYMRDNINHIPAVCVEECVGAAHLNVLLAINRRSKEGGEQVLNELKTGFERIFLLLAKQADGASTEDEVFGAIVSMCSGRILHRLGLIRGQRKTQRRSIKQGLQTALDYLKRNEQSVANKNQPASVLHAFINRARVVIKSTDAWSKHQTQSQLEDLVNSVRCLQQVGDFRALIDDIPNRGMDPGSRTHLINMIDKVTRYREAARFLYRTAEKIPLVRKLRIVVVKLPQGAFEKDPTSNYTPNLDGTVSLIDGLKKKEKDVVQICNLLGSSEKEAKGQFAEQTRRVLQEAKIHAEIQLLYYCEFHRSPNSLLPRVVCSSKDACWLCNEFILMYGKIHTPRCHGKLYPGWRLPAPLNPEHHDFMKRYNTRLQGRLKESLKTLFTRQKKTVHPDPRESTLLALTRSSSTLATLASPTPENMKNENEQEAVFPTGDRSVLGIAPANDEESKETSAEEDETGQEDILAQQASPIPSEVSSTASKPPTNLSASEPPSSLPHDLTLELGIPESQHVPAGQTSPFFKAGVLEVQIEYVPSSPDAGPSGARRKNLSCAIEWLTPEYVEDLRSRREVNVVAAGSLEGEVEHCTDGDGCVYISAGEAVVRVCLRPEMVG